MPLLKLEMICDRISFVDLDMRSHIDLLSEDALKVISRRTDGASVRETRICHRARRMAYHTNPARHYPPPGPPLYT
jgi:hypothetical protein